MTTELRLASDVARAVLDHALGEAPLECCGVLTGPKADLATRAWPASNVHGRPRTEYEVDPQALLEAVERTEGTDEEIVGFYHSHPRGPAGFSQTDQERGSWQEAAYLLVSLKPLAWRAARWSGDAFEEIPLKASTPS